MIIFLIVSTIAGVILGLRFKVFVLGPATLLATVAIAVTAIASGHEATAIVLAVLRTLASLQTGYFAGCILHAMVLAHLPAQTKIKPLPPQIGADKILNSAPPTVHRGQQFCHFVKRAKIVFARLPPRSVRSAAPPQG